MKYDEISPVNGDVYTYKWTIEFRSKNLEKKCQTRGGRGLSVST